MSLHGAVPWFIHPEYPKPTGGDSDPAEPEDVSLPEPTLRMGDRGEPVERWQNVLISSGLRFPIVLVADCIIYPPCDEAEMKISSRKSLTAEY